MTKREPKIGDYVKWTNPGNEPLYHVGLKYRVKNIRVTRLLTSTPPGYFDMIEYYISSGNEHDQAYWLPNDGVYFMCEKENPITEVDYLNCFQANFRNGV